MATKPAHVWALIAGTLTGLLWFGGGFMAALSNLGAAHEAPAMQYIAYAWIGPSVLLPFAIYPATRRWPWIGLPAIALAPLSFTLLGRAYEVVVRDWRLYEAEIVPKIVEQHLPGVLPKGIRMGSRWYFPSDKSAHMECSYQASLENVASHIRQRLPSDWIEVRVKYFDDTIAEEYKKDLLKKELGIPRFVSPRLGGRQNALALGGSDDGTTDIYVDIGMAHVMRGDVLWAKKLDGTPLPVDEIKNYRLRQ